MSNDTRGPTQVDAAAPVTVNTASVNVNPEDIVPERFHPSTVKAGLPQIDLPCYDPSCMAEPGEECGPFCTHGEPPAAPGRGDLVLVTRGEFAVRCCPRCSGTGRDSASPDRSGCRCRVDSLSALEMRAVDLYEQTKEQNKKQAARTLAAGRRCDAYALVAALRELKVSARVHMGSATVYSVVIDTRFGRIYAGIARGAAERLHVQRVDATQWNIDAWGDVRAIARTLCSTVPELARKGDRLDWMVAIVPTNANAAALCWVGREAPGTRCRFCVDHTSACPGMRAHMWEARNRWRMSPVAVVFGAIPMPAESPQARVPGAEALDEAIRPIVHMVTRRELIIT